MERHFALPIVIAAAVHGLLFGIPGGKKPAVVERPNDGDVLPPFVLPLEPRVIDVRERTDSSESGTSERVLKLPEVPLPNTGRGILIPIPVDSGARYLPDVTTHIPGAPYSGGEGGGGAGFGPGVGVIGSEFLDRTPNARVRIPPEYPLAARRHGREATVNVEFVVDESGRVLETRALTSDNPEFERAAVRAVSKWRFEPGTVKGTPVRFRMVVPIVFRLNAE